MNFLPIVVILIMFVIYQWKNKITFGSTSYLFLVYLLMGIMSIALFYSGLFQSVFKYSLEAMLYMSICLIIIFYGFISFNEEKIKSIEIDNLNVYMVIETTLIIGGFSAILFFIPFAIKGLSGDVELNRINNGIFQQKVLASYGIVNSLLSLFANLFILAIVFSFINFSRGPKFKIRAYLLLLSSFSYVIYILAYVGRDGIAYWLLSFIFVFFLMKNFLNSSLVKKIRLFFILFVVVLSIPFLIISFARFGSTSSDITWAIINYMGQQVKNFNDTYQVDAPLEYGRSIFPAFINWIEFFGYDIPNESSRIDIPSYYLSVGVATTIFKTYLGELLTNFGKGGTLFFIILLTMLTKRIVRITNRTKSWRLSNLILFILLYQIVLWGVFYFRLYSANYYIIAVFLLVLLLKVFPPKKIIIKLSP